MPTLLLWHLKSPLVKYRDASTLKRLKEKKKKKEGLECSIKYILTQTEMPVTERKVKQPTTVLTSSQ